MPKRHEEGGVKRRGTKHSYLRNRDPWATRKNSNDRRRRKKKPSNIKNIGPLVTNDTEPVIFKNTVATASSVIPHTDVPTAAPDERSSTSSKINNGTANLPVQTNGQIETHCPLVRNTSVLFHALCYSEDVLSSLPNRSWAIHSCEAPEKQVVVSTMIMYNLGLQGLTPIYTKQIIFDEKLNFNILLVNSRIVLKDKPTSINTMHDFESLLDYVDSMKVCAGGPPVSQYSKVNPECAYKDSMSNWRHNLCTLEISFGEVCESCGSLDEILRRRTQRIKTSPKSRNASKRKNSGK